MATAATAIGATAGPVSMPVHPFTPLSTMRSRFEVDVDAGKSGPPHGDHLAAGR